MGFFDKIKNIAKDFISDDKDSDVYQDGVMVDDEDGKNEFYAGCQNFTPEQWQQANNRLIEAIRDKLDSGRIKENPDNEDIEIRGRINNRPVRIVWSYSDLHPDDPSVELQCSETIPVIDLERDYDQIPKEKDVDEDWGDEDQELRIFVAKGIFVEGDEDAVNETLGNFKALPQEMADKMLQKMEAAPLTYLRTGYETVESVYDIDVVKMQDPVNEIYSMAELLDEIATLYDKGEAKARNQNQTLDYKRVSCKYCSTMFILDKKSNCPNCGAPYDE